MSPRGALYRVILLLFASLPSWCSSSSCSHPSSCRPSAATAFVTASPRASSRRTVGTAPKVARLVGRTDQTPDISLISLPTPRSARRFSSSSRMSGRYASVQSHTKDPSIATQPPRVRSNPCPSPPRRARGTSSGETNTAPKTRRTATSRPSSVPRSGVLRKGSTPKPPLPVVPRGTAASRSMSPSSSPPSCEHYSSSSPPAPPSSIPATLSYC